MNIVLDTIKTKVPSISPIQNISNISNLTNLTNRFKSSKCEPKFKKKDIFNKHRNYKEAIPKRIREFVWTTYNGEIYSSKCYISWCDNQINVFNYQVVHDIPASKGGTLDIDNLKPICSNCNLSMGNKYTIQEWSNLINEKKKQNMNTIIE